MDRIADLALYCRVLLSSDLSRYAIAHPRPESAFRMFDMLIDLHNRTSLTRTGNPLLVPPSSHRPSRSMRTQPSSSRSGIPLARSDISRWRPCTIAMRIAPSLFTISPNQYVIRVTKRTRVALAGTSAGHKRGHRLIWICIGVA